MKKDSSEMVWERLNKPKSGNYGVVFAIHFLADLQLESGPLLTGSWGTPHKGFLVEPKRGVLD